MRFERPPAVFLVAPFFGALFFVVGAPRPVAAQPYAVTLGVSDPPARSPWRLDVLLPNLGIAGAFSPGGYHEVDLPVDVELRAVSRAGHGALTRAFAFGLGTFFSDGLSDSFAGIEAGYLLRLSLVRVEHVGLGLDLASGTTAADGQGGACSGDIGDDSASCGRPIRGWHLGGFFSVGLSTALSGFTAALTLTYRLLTPTEEQRPRRSGGPPDPGRPIHFVGFSFGFGFGIFGH